MKAFFEEMRILYSTRHIRKIDPYIKKWLSPDCCIIGTSLAELSCTPDDICELFDSDLRYWYDLNIDNEKYTEEIYGEYSFCTCPAILSYTVNENKERYESYGQFCNDLASDKLSGPYVNASRIAYVLDTLLSSRKKSRRENLIGVTVYVISKDGKVQFIAFSIDNTIDSTDCYYNGSESVMEDFAEEKSLLSHEKNNILDAYLREKGYSEWSYQAQDNGIFYGVGLIPRNESREQAMKRVLDEFSDADDYQSLFNLRLTVSRLQCAYAIEDNPKAIIRFFGIMSDKGVALFIPAFPNVYYLEKK